MFDHETLKENAQKDKYVTFKSGAEYFGLKIEYVNEIIVIQEITKIPESEDYVKGLNFHFVTSMMEVLDLALEKEQDVNDLDYNQYLMNTHKRVAGFLSHQDNEITRQSVN